MLLSSRDQAILYACSRSSKHERPAITCCALPTHASSRKANLIRARPIQLFQAYTDIFKIFMPIPITDILRMIFCQ